jgi:hypothetical protein
MMACLCLVIAVVYENLSKELHEGYKTLWEFTKTPFEDTSKYIKQTSVLKRSIVSGICRDVATLSGNKRGMWQHLNSKKQQEQIDCRRAKVLELMSKG